jgi:hypothetical protein
MRFLACGIAAVVSVWLPRTIDGAQVRPSIPVMVGGQEADEGCAGTAIVAVRVGTLNLRAGPGSNHPVLARLRNGQNVTICQRLQSGWVGVLVPRDSAKPRDCRVSDAGPTPTAYAGPCHSGWVRETYVRVLAG